MRLDFLVLVLKNSYILSIEGFCYFLSKESFSYIFSKKAFIMIPKTEPCNFQAKLQKEKNSTPGKFIIVQETETPKRQLKAALMFWWAETPKNFLYFRKWKFLIFPEMKLSSLIFQKINFRAQKVVEPTVLFKSLLHFRKELTMSQK